MKNNVDFLFSYEHKAREGEAIILLKLMLEELGYTVALTSSYEEYTRKRINAKIVIISAAYDNDVVDFFANYVTSNVCNKIVNLQWEQILTEEEEGDKEAYHNPKDKAKNVYHLCWGTSSIKRLVASGVPKDKCILTGAVHLDFLRSEFKGCLMNKKDLSQKLNIPEDKSWTLFISSFALVNVDESVIQNLKKAYSDELIEQLIKWFTDSRTQILYWLEQYVIDNPDKILIYRPHPDEINIDDTLTSLARKYNNFKIISELAVKQWINQSDNIYNWYSTSMADVYFLNKPMQILRPYQVPKNQEVSIMVGATFIQTQVQFKENYNNKKLCAQVIDESLFKSYYCNDFNSLPAFVIITKFLCDLYNNKYKPNMLYTRKEILTIKKHKARIKIRNFIFSFIEKVIPQSLLMRPIKSRLNNILKEKSFFKKGFERNVICDNDINYYKEKLKPILDYYYKDLEQYKKK